MHSSKHPLLKALTTLTLPLLAASSSYGVAIVTWGGTDFLSGNINVASTFKGIDAINFSDGYANPTPGGTYYPDGGANASTDFYLASIGNVDGTDTGNYTFRFDNASDATFISFNAGSAVPNSVHHIYLWEKDQFLNGGDSGAVTIQGMTAGTGSNSGTTTNYFVIELNDSNYYVSESLGGSPSVADISTLTWYNYAPTVDFRDTTGLGVASIADFSGLTAAGIYVSNSLGSQYNQSRLYSFEVDGAVIPEPAHYAFAAGAALLGLAILRRRRS